jgi:hypothetical protein
MIKVIGSLTRAIVATASIYSRKLASLSVSGIKAVISVTPKKLVVSYSNKLVQATTTNKLVAVSYSNIQAKVITGPYSSGISLADILNISSAGTILKQDYVDNANYFLEDYAGSSINITQ